MPNATPNQPRGYALAQVPRPTEKAALRNTPAPALDLIALFDGLLIARATGDARALSLCAHAIARISGGTA